MENCIVDDEMHCHDRVATMDVGERLRVIARGVINGAVPNVLVAADHIERRSVAVPDGQVESDGGVAPRNICKRVSRRNYWRFVVCFAVPGELVTGYRVGVACVAVTDGQMQRHHGIAARSVSKRKRGSNSRSLIVCLTVPRELITCEGSGVSSIGMTNGQMQGHHGIATGSVDEGMRRLDHRRFVVSTVIPSELIAGKSGGVTGIAMSNGQMQRHHRVATRNVCKRVSRRNYWRFVVCFVVPREFVAGKSGGVAGVGMTNGQMQRNYGVTTRNVCKDIGRCNHRSFIVCFTIPSEFIASKGGGVTGIGMTNGQMKGHYGVTTESVCKGIGWCNSRSLIICFTIPSELVTSESGGVASVAIIDGEVQRDHGVATCGIGERVGVLAAGCDISVLVPVEGVANHSVGITGVTVIDSQMQGHHRVTTRSVSERMC